MLGYRFKRLRFGRKHFSTDINSVFVPLVLGIVIVGIFIQTWSAGI